MLPETGFFEDAARVDILKEEIRDAHDAGVPAPKLIEHLLGRHWRLIDLEFAPDAETRALAQAYKKKLEQAEVAQIGACIACFLLAGGFGFIAMAINTTVPGV